ncbi:uncharacterized protein LOC107197403 isoform X1 [Astyanax mexicanus]|uniref:uncharacterized protein LOC107197403 isoform X1 n=1 Tax=Astyanax mexicanus TaxID=7994 RepID=UPI0020CB34E4|nr:uncharacterized protein LOC107197403 isoform X1 [Astyanax mexicanus]XP_049326454.1 uncharacterized protein LOC107197403 isoform X1 [Astyanax mexicanus]XP_049326456.1 uncharacterized protein LOC107197403 isoform X1 [Astyanax mexicanus]
MIHDEYLKGNLSLIISKADYSKRDWYTCECNRRDFCDVRLQIEAVTSNVEIEPGESLLLQLKISDPVQVIYNRTGSAAGSRDQICTVDGESLQSEPEYKHRTSLSSVLELRDMNVSDSGVYTVRDIRNKEDILIYTVTVTDEQHSRICKERYKDGYAAGREDGYGAGYQKGLGVGGGIFVIIGLAIGVILGVFVVPRVLHLIRTREQTEQPVDMGAADALNQDNPT